MKNDALATVSQTLAITSNLLAIGIEVGILAGGYLLYKQLTKPEETHDTTLIPEGYELVQTPEKKTSLKQRWNKAKKIFKAVLDNG